MSWLSSWWDDLWSDDSQGFIATDAGGNQGVGTIIVESNGVEWYDTNDSSWNFTSNDGGNYTWDATLGAWIETVEVSADRVSQFTNLGLDLVCGDSPLETVLGTMAFDTLTGAGNGAYVGFIGGEVIAGGETLGASGVPGAGIGAVVGGVFGAMEGAVEAPAYVAACRKLGAY